MPIQQSALKNLTVASTAMRRVGRGGGGGDDTREDDNDNNEDHNNNTTIKQCTGERGADNVGGDRQFAFGDVDDDRRRRIKALGGEDDDGGLGRPFWAWRWLMAADGGGGQGLPRKRSGGGFL